MSASNSMAATFELGFKKAMVGTVQTVSLFLCTIGFRRQSTSQLLRIPQQNVDDLLQLTIVDFNLCSICITFGG